MSFKSHTFCVACCQVWLRRGPIPFLNMSLAQLSSLFQTYHHFPQETTFEVEAFRRIILLHMTEFSDPESAPKLACLDTTIPNSGYPSPYVSSGHL